ncbi:hypothetical protein DYB37_002170 [Aphanomyces astaci]|uniref:Uncharacterized protein n=1 Tax=Aphanomyces astaci TaxID=112090 RepID=A0A3R6Y8G1_APHAT|nr:hypothetical protein DYB35_001512 [Aphanomyces astaci]RHZ23903.1 hypothetical protein DYB37_002170 [Aphanomyces astaci]
MATVGLGNELPVPEARHIPNKHVLATGATPTMPLLDSILRRDVQLALKQKAYSARALQASIAALEAVESPRPLDLSKAHPSLLRRTSSMIKPKKPADPSTRKPYVDGRRVYIPLEPEISDKRELKLLQSRRPQVEVNMCPHLQGQLTCDHYNDCLDGDVSSDVITDEDVPLSKLLEIAQQTGSEEEGTTPKKKRGRKPGPLKKALDTSTESVRRTSKRRLDEPSPPPRKSARSQKDVVETALPRNGARLVEPSKPHVRPVTAMGNALEKLRILGYEKEMSKKKNFVVFTDTSFALAAQNARYEPNLGSMRLCDHTVDVSAQFKSFLEIVVYLMKVCEQDFVVDKYDDPNTSVNKLILSLKIMGFPLDFPAAKLKQGFGEAVCSTLEFICDKALAAKGFAWAKPNYPKEEYAEEAEVDENVEVEADDEVPVEEEDEELYATRGKAEENDLDESAKQIILTSVDPLLWKTELERVGPKLKAKTKEDEGKEWHAHIEQTKKHSMNLTGTTAQLKAITSQLSEVIQRMAEKEKHINNEFDHLYHQIKEKLQGVTERCKEGSEKVNAMTTQHSDITEQLRETKSDMDSKGSKMTDTSPLVQIKAALQTLKVEIKNFELRIGVVGHTLLQSKAKQKAAHGKRSNEASPVDPEYDNSDDDLD